MCFRDFPRSLDLDANFVDASELTAGTVGWPHPEIAVELFVNHCFGGNYSSACSGSRVRMFGLESSGFEVE
ncbi:hypothetical protein BN2475_80033 [Paraburkholderia ribeironis]|uniref:Uncharacterized protein n=1 Tax=Paraburkholderia ribeironis TaxID=1247936 RepID=A0A1N7RM68_9BURK|nr:hypothetical protein BN2475_80033 [Paraburkholderia ribeironis]